jgi:hypothetical protein
MARRPERIDIPSHGALDPLSRPLFTPHGNPVAQREVPPALSPLDAFAMQGRLLAKRFEEENTAGRRMSRLPAVTIASELAKARPEYFRAMTTGSQPLASPSQLLPEEISVQRSATEVQSAQRPLSHYPQMILTDSVSGGSGRGLYYQTQLGKVQESEVEHADMAIPRSQSPEDIYTAPAAPVRTNDISKSPPLPPANSSKLCVTPTKFTIGPSLMSYPASAVPKAPSISPSIRPVYDQDDVTSIPSLEASVASLSLEKSRPLAESTHMLRTSSTNSEKSLAGTPPRPSFNYSRPISRQSGPSMEGRRAESPHRSSVNMRGPPLDTIYRQDSAEAPIPSFLNDSPQTPVSLASEELFSTPDARTDSTPASFVYAKYTLPNKTKRESLGISEFINKQFNWDDPDTESQINISFANAPFLAQTPPSPALTASPPVGFGSVGHSEVVITGPVSPARSQQSRRRLQKSRPGTPSGPTPAAAESTISLIKPHRQTLKTSPLPPPTTAPTTAMTTTITAAATASRDPVVEEHLQRGIDLHEQGALQESTYHLRIAAKAGHPTAMVLYALACRHGWGMKPAPEEGVAWLTRAVDCAHLELAEDERKGQQQGGGAEDVAASKAHKAQFALGVYELAQSYMNGWGVAQDRGLGVRCFEIAGSWGDADGLAAAAHCYMEAIGVKKDLKKSARLFRQAEARGVTVAGNSWFVSFPPSLFIVLTGVGRIHKEKYADEAPAAAGAAEYDDDDERAGRPPTRKNTADSTKRHEKSRTRAFFSRKKSNASAVV